MPEYTKDNWDATGEFMHISDEVYIKKVTLESWKVFKNGLHIGFVKSLKNDRYAIYTKGNEYIQRVKGRDSAIERLEQCAK